jgi:uncharacterized protein YkwD
MRGARTTGRIGAALAAPILILVAALAVGLWRPAPAVASASIIQLERSYLEAINAVRFQHNLPPARLDGRLRVSARLHSRDMLRGGYFAHGDFAGRIGASGAPGDWGGEVLGWTAPGPAPVDSIVSRWLLSPEHRSVLLDPRYERVGVGIARGEFEGFAGTLVITVDFIGRWSP